MDAQIIHKNVETDKRIEEDEDNIYELPEDDSNKKAREYIELIEFDSTARSDRNAEGKFI